MRSVENFVTSCDIVRYLPKRTQISILALSQDEVIATFNRQFLKIAGYTEEEIKVLGDLSKFSPKQLQELFNKKSMQSLGLNGNSRQKIVPTDEVRNWILQGWEYVRELPTDEAIIRLPNH